MEGLLGIIGTVVITVRSLKWISGIGYVTIGGISLVSAYILPKDEDLQVQGCDDQISSMKMLTEWVLYTNIIALVSALMFFYTNKGTTISVIGSLVWVMNILQSFVLFLYA